MSNDTSPQALRRPPLDFGTERGGRATCTLGMFTAACLVTAGSGAAIAQGADAALILPTIDVETSAPAPAPAAPRRQPVRRPAPAAPPAPAPAAPVAPVAEAAPAAAPGTSPYVDPAAGYRAVASGNARLQQPLLDAARSVTAITSEVMEDKGGTSVRELARTTPGITLGTGEGGNAFGDVLFIRGFKASNDTFIDGVRDAGVAVRETFMAEQVEITKGPSGSIAGRGTTGGAVNLVTKKPLDEDFVETGLSFGTHLNARATLDWNKVHDDRFSTRLNLMAEDGEVAGRDGVHDRRRGIAAAARWKATEDLTLTLDAYHLEMDQMPDWGIPWDAANGVPFTEPGAGRPTLDRDTFYGVTDRDFLKGSQDIVTLGLAYEIAPDVTLTSRLRAGRTVNDYVLTAPERPVITAPDWADWTLGASPKSRYQVNEVLASQTELSFGFDTGGIRHKMLAGLDLSDEDISQQGYQGLASESGGGTAPANLTGCTVTIFNPDTTGCFDPAVTDLVRGPATLTKVRTRSAYIIDTMELAPDWELNLGVRIDNYDISKSGLTGGAPYRYARDDTMFNWNAGLTWKPAPNGTVYLAYATSSNPMGQELDAGGGDYNGLDAAGQLLDPEKNRSFELGTKWEFGNLLLTAALFETEKDKARENVRVGTATVTDDTGRYRVRGLELGVAGRLGDRLSLFGGLTVMDSKILDSMDPANIGRSFANIAHEQFNLLAKYDVTDRLTLGGQVTWRGEIKGGTFAASNGNTLPGYWRVDALVEYEVAPNTDLRLSIQNLTDETYYDAFYRSGTPYVYVAPGRSAAISLNMKF